MADYRLLDELFRALFRSDAELRRFLVLQGLSVSDFAVPATKSRSRSETSSQVARALDERGLITPALFEALERRSPDRRADIRSVARAYQAAPPDPDLDRGESGTVRRLRGTGQEPAQRGQTSGDEPATATAEPPARYAEFAKSLRSELAALEDADPVTDAMHADRWPWTAAAATLGSFRPAELRPLADGSQPSTPPLVALVDVVFPTHDGRWVLRDDVRSRALERLHREDALQAALDANAGMPDGRRDLLRRLLEGSSPPLHRLDARELEDLDVVTGWLRPLGVAVDVSRETILAAVERRGLIDPLRALVGTHFRGRAEELAMVQRHLEGAGPETVLLLHGPGGAGKSTLIGRVLLDLEERARTDPVSFAYVDFDKARNNPRNPARLLEQIARQLRLLYATAEAGTTFAAIESYVGGTDVGLASEVLDIEQGLDISQMIEVLSGRLELVRASHHQRRWPPLVLVLDTFEEVQIKGPGAVRDVLDLVGRLQAEMPTMRVVVSGRGVVTEFHGTPTIPVTLGDLDLEAADALLEDLGVRDGELRRLINERFGRNPLTLRLAAEALQRIGSVEEAFAGELARADVLARVALEQVQGMLYSRILGHIGSSEIASIAHPGLAVRRVTVDLIREVLAIPCGLDPARAEEIFERLRLEVTMFEPEEPDALRHRQDVRRLMLRTMLDEPARRETVEEIHRRAIVYYAARPELSARAEELYHRLMSGEDTRNLGQLWTSGMEDLLASAMEEPLPARARQWLGRRLGLGPVDERGEWDQDDWEASAASRASSWLASGDPTRALEVLSERSERLPASRLYAVEVAARLAGAQLDQAGEVLDRGLRSALEEDDRAAELDLVEQAIAVRAGQGEAAGVADAGRSAAALCDLTGQQQRAILALADAISKLQVMAAETEAAALAADLSARFARMSRSEMRDRPDIVLRVLHTAGRMDSAVLVHAAHEVGDQTDTGDAVFNDDAFLIERLLAQTSSGATTALTDLAKEVGLDAETWDLGELASLTVRTGRIGKAVALGLDYAADDAAARSFVTESLLRPEQLAVS